MNECSHVQEAVLDYLEDQLPTAEREAVERHLERCRACSATVQSYREILSAYREAPEADVDEVLAARLLANARHAAPERRPLRRVGVALTAAAVLLVVGLAYFKTSASRHEEPRNVTALLREGDALRDAADLERATDAYEAALRLAADDELTAAVLHRLGSVYLARHEPARALERLRLLLETWPDYRDRAEALLLLGDAWAGVGDPERAIEAYQLVAHADPDRRTEAEQRIAELAAPLSVESLQGLGYVGD